MPFYFNAFMRCLRFSQSLQRFLVWRYDNTNTHTHTHPFNDPFSRTTQVSWYQIGKTNLDFTEARDSEWQWHQLGHIQVCTSLQADNHASTPLLSFLQAGCPSCCPTNSVKALQARQYKIVWKIFGAMSKDLHSEICE